MAKLIMGIGIPGSGKTTALRKIVDEYGYDYICPDDLRTEMYHETEDWTTPEKMAIWKERNKEVWNEARKRLKDFLWQEHTVVFDATFTQLDARKEFLDFARESGAEKIQGIVLDAPPEVAKERNQKRGRHVRDVDIERMAGELKETKPRIEEGFDGIFTLDEYQNLVMAEIKSGEGSLKKGFR